MRRQPAPLYGARYCGNLNKKEIHDLDNEDTSASGCQIDEIIRANHAMRFDSLPIAHGRGYDNCAKCLGGSTR